MESNHERAVFYPVSDSAYSFSRDRAIGVLSSWRGDEVESINDCIEVHQCKMILDNHKHLFSDAPYGDLSKNARKLFGIACKRASSLIESMGIVKVFQGVEAQYQARLWVFLSSGGLYKRASSEELRHLLCAYPSELHHVIEHEVLLREFDDPIADAMEQNPDCAARLIISSFGSRNHQQSMRGLPSALTNDRIDRIMLDYMSGDDVNLNHVRVLAHWPKPARDWYRPSPEVLVTARRKADELNSVLFADELTSTIAVGSTIAFSPSQTACKAVDVKDGELIVTFSTKWLMEFIDSATILNNFIYMFEFVDSGGMLVAPAHKNERSAVFEIMGLHPLEEYPGGIQFNMRNSRVMTIVFAYRRLLLEAGTRLEDAVEWFFNTYIEEEFGISGFSINLPAEEASFLDKCKAIGPEIEGVLKAYKLYASHGEIDSEYFLFTSVKEFISLKSLMQEKYLVEGERYSEPARAMLSDQSWLAYSETHGEYGCFFLMLVRERVQKGDFHDFCQPLLDGLLERGFVVAREDGSLSPSKRACFLKAIWEDGAVPNHLLTTEDKAIGAELVGEGYLRYSETLFTPDEADYLNYMYNDAKFSNPVALRNKYAHASRVVDDPNAQSIEEDYCRMLALLIMICLKINEELSLEMGKGGVEDFVDWPLVGEEQRGC